MKKTERDLLTVIEYRKGDYKEDSNKLLFSVGTRDKTRSNSPKTATREI